MNNLCNYYKYALMAEMVDAADLSSAIHWM